jgi:hypothetical protein
MGDNSGNGEWEFCVQAETAHGETLAVVGDCQELGQWKLQNALDLKCGNEGYDTIYLLFVHLITVFYQFRNIWRATVRLPRGKPINYRYLVCVLVPSDGEQVMETVRVIRRWETHPQPRKITQQGTIFLLI